MRSTLAILLLAGCTTSNPGSGAAISYLMPLTKAEATLTVEYEGCKNQTAAPPKIEFKQDISLELSAGADRSKSYEIEGSSLRHWRQTRDVSISVSKLGVIDSVNAAGGDKSAEIVTNVLSSLSPLASLTGFGILEDNPYQDVDLCDLLIPDALDSGFRRSKSLESDIKDIQREISKLYSSGQPVNGNGHSITDLQEIATVLAQELVRLRTQFLTVKAKTKVPLETSTLPAEGKFEFPASGFAKWGLENSYQNALIDKLRTRKLSFTFVDSKPTNVIGTVKEECKTQITVPRPDTFTLAFKPSDPTLLKIPVSENQNLDLVLGIDLNSSLTKEIPIQQWSTPGAVCLDLNFGESRTVVLKFDEFGRTTSFGWKSNARGEAISGAISGALTQLHTLSEEFESDTETERQAAEIARLETEQKYNKLQECAAIIEAGGYECEPEE